MRSSRRSGTSSSISFAGAATARSLESTRAPASALEPLDVLFEDDSLPELELPVEIRRLYGGNLGFTSPRLVANFVSTLDGVVAVPAVPRSHRLIAANSAADRFVMGLLRAFADVVVVGAGTLHGSPAGTWQPSSEDPVVERGLSELRETLGSRREPEVAILTRSGDIDADHPVFARGALVLTTRMGEARLRDRLPAATTVVSLGRSVEPSAVVSALRDRGHAIVLTEGGPTVFGSFLSADVVDELFLTVSPLVAGRDASEGRLQLVEGASWVPGEGPSGRMLSVRRHGSHLFLRYEIG